MDELQGSLQIGGDIGTDEGLIQDFCLSTACHPLDEGEVEEAAQPLLDRGATVAIILDKVDVAALIANPDSSREEFFDWLMMLERVMNFDEKVLRWADEKDRLSQRCER